jgi:hypothetical protein
MIKFRDHVMNLATIMYALTNYAFMIYSESGVLPSKHFRRIYNNGTLNPSDSEPQVKQRNENISLLAIKEKCPLISRARGMHSGNLSLADGNLNLASGG